MTKESGEMVRPNVQAAANWWGDKLRHAVFDNGDTSRAGFMSHLMASILHQTPTDEQIDRFVCALSVAMTKLVESNHGSVVHVGVDYNPDRVLLSALHTAGIEGDNLTTLPWKTRMRIEPDGEVRVGDGYRVPWKTIYPA